MYYVKKFIHFIVLVWVAITLNFLMPHLMPGNPMEALVAKSQGKISPVVMHALALQFGIDNKPLWQKYIDYMTQLLHGNLGVSITYYPVDVKTVIGQALPWTLILVGVTTILAFLIGTLIGIVAAWRRNKLFDSIMGPIWMFLGSVPQFWLALLLLYYFAFKLGWFPEMHSYNYGDSPSWSLKFLSDAVWHSILPACALLFTTIGGWMLAMRNNMIQIISDDFIAYARARGLRPWNIMMVYAARNAILPSVTQFAIALGYAVGGQILIEEIFSYPGIGYQLAQAVITQDYPLMQGIFFIIAVVMLLANFVVDILYTRLDPRVRTEGASA
ncbi:ABC transporter permease [Alicyclobacillus acidiphilus]|jgi:peptide/nickel transport system permease protein|uniref:ABC transporter permease n=1 Tax=Alicyclobacillus acidiphilus TaxID=182455 RepID=UPI0008371268|nr:ABC transporter permease [Alicyclobacillus acidiphilus]